MDWKHIATLSVEEQMRAWVQNWKRVGPELEEIKKRELRAMTEEEGTRRAIQVMNFRVPRCSGTKKEPATSGLIEQQRIFKKAFPSS